MYNRYALLAILLIQTLGASVVGARGSAITGRASLRADTTYPCTLDVVLVAFQDTTAERPMSRMDCGSFTCDYHEHDRPYGYTSAGMPTNSSYRLRDFERLFNGGYGRLEDSPFVGDAVTVANGRLPYAGGSVRQCAGVLRLDVQWGVPTTRAHD